MTQLEISLQAQNEKLQQKIQLMQSISTRDKFHAYFFKICNEFKTREEAFEHLNGIYHDHFGGYLFTNYTAFRQYNLRKSLKK